MAREYQKMDKIIPLPDEPQRLTIRCPVGSTARITPEEHKALMALSEKCQELYGCAKDTAIYHAKSGTVSYWKIIDKHTAKRTG